MHADASLGAGVDYLELGAVVAEEELHHLGDGVQGLANGDGGRVIARPWTSHPVGATEQAAGAIAGAADAGKVSKQGAIGSGACE